MRGWRGERGLWYKTLFILYRVEGRGVVVYFGFLGGIIKAVLFLV